MVEIERLGKDSLTECDLYFLSINSVKEIPERMNISSPNFICLIAWDSHSSTVEEISSLVEPLMKNGASYFCTWGSDCERVHDIIDEIDSYPYNDIGSHEDSVIMTTWHSDESLEDTLHFFLNSTWPDKHYEDTTHSSLAIVIGNEGWAEETKKAFLSPRQFTADFLKKVD